MRHDGHGNHVARWPPPWLRDRRRVPAILVSREDTWMVVDPDGESWPVRSHRDVLEVAGHPYADPQIRLDVFVSKIGHYPFLADALDGLGRGTTAYANLRGASGLACRFGRATIRIGESAPWGYEQADPQFLRDLAGVFAWLGVGAQVTPAGLGHATMVRQYHDAAAADRAEVRARYPEASEDELAEHVRREAKHRPQSRPCSALRRAFLDHRIGARSDPPISDERYPTVYELDLHDAYCAMATQPLPCGPVERFCDNNMSLTRNRYVTWFARCTVFLDHTFPNAPILTRDATGRLHPLTAKGAHEVWVWREEAAAMAGCGAVVLVHDGWGWRETAPILREWATWMHARRRDAPAPEVAALVKRCITAGIGRHGMPPESRRLARAKDAPDGAQLVDASPGTEPLCIVKEKDVDAPWLTHVHEYIVMLVRMWQWERRCQEEEDGQTVVATNTDAVYVLRPSARAKDAARLGGVRERARHDVRFPYDRGLVSLEKIALPGLKRGSAQRERIRDGPI